MPEERDRFKRFRAALEERETFSVDIEGEEFVFPKSPKAEFGLRLYEIIEKHDGELPDREAVALIPLLVGDESFERLISKVTVLELAALLTDLLIEYGFIAETVVDAVPFENREARRKKASTSPKQSSTASRSSKQTSAGSTG